MQVAVAGVEHVADAQPDARLERPDAAEHLGQLRPRHDAVLHVVVRRDAAHRGERGLAAAPDPRALLVVCRRSRSCVAPARAADRLDHGEQRVDFGGRTVELDDEHRVGLREIRGCTAASAARMASASIISIAAGTMPARDDVRHGAPAGVDRVERREQRLHRFRASAGSGRSTFVTIAERAFRSDRAARAGPVPARRAIGLPMSTRSPSGSTASTPSTWCTVKPYLRQCAPPEFSATLPPIEQTCWLDGSGA